MAKNSSIMGTVRPNLATDPYPSAPNTQNVAADKMHATTPAGPEGGEQTALGANKHHATTRPGLGGEGGQTGLAANRKDAGMMKPDHRA